MNLVTRSGTLLRSHPYSESSRILRFLTPDAGVVAVMARGARRQASKGGGPMDLFDEVEITYGHRADRDLHTLREYRAVTRRRELGADLVRFGGASFLAELILTHTLEEASPELHTRLGRGLDALRAADPGAVPGELMAAGWGLLAAFGFPPEVEHCVRCGGTTSGEGMGRFDVAGGGLRCPSCARGGTGPRLGPGARTELREVLSGTPPTPLRGAPAHFQLLERFAIYHLDRRRPFLSSATLLPLLEAAGEPVEGSEDESGKG